MKLATLKTADRDGQLIVVSHDLTLATKVPDIAHTLQQALDKWEKCEPALKTIYNELNAGKIKDNFPFDANKVHSPLPRAYQWADASAYVNHVQLVRKSRGVEMPESFWTDPLMYQGGSDSFLGPCAPIVLASAAWGIDFEAEVAVITKDVPMGISEAQAGKYIALIMLVNDVSLRNLAKAELDKGFGFFNCKPSSSFSPVAVTPDELKEAWDGHKVHLPLTSYLNNKLFGEPNAGVDMTFGFPKLISHAAKTRPLTAGTIIGSGTVSNSDRTKGSSCIVEKRMLETIENGKPSTEFMQFGDTVRIEMFDKQGLSIFGAIKQTVTQYEGPHV
ncbi:MAG: fumarylacetoacetate hydrolase family protein [Proteobacteria bacterium]|nr:fumarylacetoacetate hydrolase family protein [Pseudomonadota bacterium]